MKNARNLAVLTLMLVVAAACATQQTMTGQYVSAAEIRTQPANFVDREIALQGPVRSMITARALEVGSGENTVLVILDPKATDMPMSWTSGTNVDVTGTVTMAGEIVKMPVYSSWDQAMWDRHRDQPVVIASSVRVVP